MQNERVHRCLFQIGSWSISRFVSTEYICAGNRRLSTEKNISKTPFQEVDYNQREKLMTMQSTFFELENRI